MPVCTNCGQDNPGVAKFCLACGSPIEGAAAPAPPAPPEEERKLITVVFTDLVGSTARSESLDPEDVKAMVALYHARVRAELERFGGTFEKFSGDAVMALFGAPVAHEDDPERAVRAALAIRDALAELNAGNDWLDLHIRTGVNTGEALVMLDARPDEGEWMAAGDVMNTAARVQSGAPVDGILVGEETYRATRRVIEYRAAEPVQAKGKTDPVAVWEVVGVKEEVARRPTSRIPLVGREAELERLWRLWEEVEQQRGRVLATVVGPPGIGKTRLLRELGERISESGGAMHWGRCLSYGEGITYWPVTEIVKGAAGILQSDDSGTAREKLGALLDSLGTDDVDQLRTMAAAISNLVGVSTTPRGTYSAAEISQAELHWGIRRVLELLAATRPLLLVFEDLHWAEPTLLELLRSIVDGAAEAPILVVGTARPELVETSPTLVQEGGNRRVIELDALSAEAGEAMLAGLLGVEDLAASPIGQSLLGNAGGNPLFLEETVAMLADAGVLAGEGVEQQVEQIPVPSSLQALIASRLDQLPGGEKRVAQHASVAGTIFWPGVLSHMGAHGDGAPGNGGIVAVLEALERRDVVREQETSSVAGEDEYAFKHVLMRDVAYAQLPKGRRMGLHVRFAEWVAALPGREDEFVEFVAYHLEQACRLTREVARPPEPPPVEAAIDALIRAAEKAERREGTSEAARFYERALEIAGDDHPEQAAELRLRRSRLLFYEGELRPAYGQLLEVAEEAGKLGRLDVRCGALVVLADIAQVQGRPAEARRLLIEAEPLAAQIGDRQWQIKATYTLAQIRGWVEGEVEAAVDDLRRALAIAEEIEDRALRIEGHGRAAALLFNTGALAEAEHELVQLIALAHELGSNRDEAKATALLAFVRYYRGELDEADRLALQAREWLDRTCDSYLQIQNLRNMAKYALARDDPQLAEQRLRDALPLALEGGGWVLIEIYRYLAEALVRQGRLDDASELLAFAARNVPEDDSYARAALLLAEAIVATAGGEQAAASTSFAEALRLLEDQQLLVDLAEARVALARALRSFGDTAGARTELERARATFMRMDARLLTGEIEEELAALAEGAGSAGPRSAS